VDTALLEAKRRNEKGIRVVFDLLGEDIRSPGASDQVTKNYLDLIGRIGSEQLNAAISVKLSSLGYMNDLDRAFDNMFRISAAAKAANVRFEMDMEWTPMVDHTIEIAVKCSKAGQKVRVATQAYLNRTADDIGYLQVRNVEIRLVKGAYRGEASDFNDIQKRFINLLTKLAGSKKEFSIGTHDPEIIAFATEFLTNSKDRIEFGFLRGLSDETKLKLASSGWKVAEYIPIGQDTKGYIGRREAYLQKLTSLGRAPSP